MNERIRELARKNADYWINHYDRKSLADMELLHKDVEKFAELIVRECAKVCESMQLIGPYKEVQDATLKDATVQILEHFGIEE